MFRTLSALCMVAFTSVAAASFPEMSRQLPTDTNAIVAINLDRIMASDLAKEKQWEQKWTSAYEYGPVAIPPGTARVLGGFHVGVGGSGAKWTIALMEMKKPMPLTQIARAEAGYADKIWSKMAVTSPAGVTFVQMDPQTLAGVLPADRQFISRWIRDTEGRKTSVESEYLKKAVNELRDSGIVIALDMNEAYIASDIRNALETGVINIEDEKADLDTISHLLAAMQGVNARFDVTDAVNATITADFSMPPAVLEFYGPQILSDLLQRAGVDVPEFKQAKAKVQGNQLIIQTALEPQSFREIMSLVSLPSPSVDTALQTASDDPKVIGEASRTYFRAVDAILSQTKSPDKTFAASANTITSAAERIERLPVMNVDEQLLSWGTQVASNMRQVAVMLRSELQATNARRLGVLDSNGVYYHDYDGGYSNVYRSDRTAQKNVARQRAQVASEQKSQAINKANEIMGGLTQQRGEIRATMSKKYGMEF